MSAKESEGLERWEYPKKSGIWIRPITYTKQRNGKTTAYQSLEAIVPTKLTGGPRKRKQFKNKSNAQKWAASQYRGATKQGVDFFKASDAERREFAKWMPELRKSGITLEEAAQFAIERLRPEGGERTVSAVAAELIASKELRFNRGDLRERSFKDFRNRASKFAESFEGKLIKDLSLSDITDWLKGLELKPRTTKNYLSIIGEVLRFACQKQFVKESPLDRLTDSERKELVGSDEATKQPSVLTIEQSRRLLEGALAHPELDLLGAVILGLFCGIRVEELKRLDWANVKDGEECPIVTISHEIAKKRRIRNVDIPDIAIRWLSLVDKRNGTVAKGKHHDDYRRRFNELLKLSGFGEAGAKGKWISKWETNAMRHSFGSYHFALHGNATETSRLLGHKSNDQVLFDHYRALATKEQGKAFFSIDPPKSESKLVEFAG